MLGQTFVILEHLSPKYSQQKRFYRKENNHGQTRIICSSPVPTTADPTTAMHGQKIIINYTHLSPIITHISGDPTERKYVMIKQLMLLTCILQQTPYRIENSKPKQSSYSPLTKIIILTKGETLQKRRKYSHD